MIAWRMIKESEAQLLDQIAAAKKETGPWAKIKVWSLEYRHSWGIRGDNVPEYATYLGYLNAKELYPNLKGISFEDFVKELLDGKGNLPYKNKTPP